MKIKRILCILAIALCASAVLVLTGCNSNGAEKLVFKDEAFKEAVAAALDKPADTLTKDDLSEIVGISVYHYAERIGSGNEYQDACSVSLQKKGFHAAYEKYYAVPEQEREGLQKPSDFSYYDDTLKTFTGYEDLKYFDAVRDLTFISEYTIMKFNPLTFITHMKSLETLSVSNYVIPDLVIPSMLKNLKSLSIGVNPRLLGDGETIEYISDLSPIKSLEKLESLSLSGNDISDLSALASLKNLTSLSCTMSSLSDISSIASAKSLEYVNLYFNAISDVEPLTKLPELRNIILDYNYITDVSPFAKLDSKKIEFVSLDMNSIEDLTHMKHLGKDKIYVGYDIYWDEN